jgi:hypothetical protein
MPRHLRNDDGVMCEVVKYTDSCTGCCESGEYGCNLHNYPFDAKAGCYIGSGCSECGYTGKRRVTLYIPVEQGGPWLSKASGPLDAQQ